MVLAIHSRRSEEHTSELQSRGLISYAVFCLKKKHYGRADQQRWHRRQGNERSTTVAARASTGLSTVCGSYFLGRGSRPLIIVFFFISVGPPRNSPLFPQPPPSR